MEKIHGTSTSVGLVDGDLHLECGGVSSNRFTGLFDLKALTEKLGALSRNITIYGETYGGSCQKMSHLYGKELRFIAFDVKIDEVWLSTLNACDVAKKCGLEFVPFARIPATMEAINAERDKPSRQAVLNGIENPGPSEGVVLRPLEEMTLSNGDRVCAKHKSPEFSERASKRDTMDPGQLEIMKDAEKIAEEWVTPVRMQHVTDRLTVHLGRPVTPKDTKLVIDAMVEDVEREGAGEIAWSPQVSKAIQLATGKHFNRGW